MSQVTLRSLREFKNRVNPEERQGAYGLYFVRPFSIYFTFLALKAGVSANQVTVLQTLLGIVGAACLGAPLDWIVIVGLVLLQFGFVLDNVDGEVARFNHQVSVTGKYLDTIGHQYVVPSIFFFLGMGTYLRLGTLEAIVFGFSAGLFSLRFDIINMYHEASQLVESKTDQAHDYYEKIQFHDGTSSADAQLYRQKNAESRLRIVYALFAYPALMNILSVLIIFDLLLKSIWVNNPTNSTVYWALALYGIILPGRRAYTIRRIVRGKEVEKKYLSILNQTRSGEASHRP